MSKCQLKKQFRVESKPFMPQRGMNGEIAHNGAFQCNSTGMFAGGRSMSGGNPVCGSATSLNAGPPLDGPLAALLAARDAQDRMLATPALQAIANEEKKNIQSQAIVVAQQHPKKSGSKDADIQAILDGDF